MKKLLLSLLCVWMVLVGNIGIVYADLNDGLEEVAEEDCYSYFSYIEDKESGQVLLDFHATEQIYPASMTKIMTLIVALENLPDESVRVEITQEMIEGLEELNAATIEYAPGATPTVKDLLYSAAILSAADSCNALAYEVAGGIEPFVALMNQKVQELGLKHTHFMNAHGLHEDEHYSTCEDIAKLFRYCLENERFVQLIQTPTYDLEPQPGIPYGMKMESFSWKLSEEHGVIGFQGGKTGFTYEAEHCLVSHCIVSGMDLLIVTAYAPGGMYAQTHFADHATITHYLDQNYSKRELIPINGSLKQITLKHVFSKETKEYYMDHAVTYDLPNDVEITYEVDLPSEVELLLDEQVIDGEVSFYGNGEFLTKEPIQITIPKETNFFYRMLLYIKTKWYVQVGLIACLLGAIGFVLSKRKRIRKQGS